jgi:hypothetical protein
VRLAHQLGATLLGIAAVLAAARSAEPKVDGELLEFLGSVDTEDKDWHEYLARTDIDKVAQRAARAPPMSPAAPSPKDPAGGTRPAPPPPPAAPSAPADQT